MNDPLSLGETGYYLAKAVQANPVDDLAKLVLADWLEEDGRYASWGRAIRLGIEHRTRYETDAKFKTNRRQCPLAKKIFKKYERVQIGRLAAGVAESTKQFFAEIDAARGPESWVPGSFEFGNAVEWEDGFIVGVYAPLKQFLWAAPILAAYHPVQVVQIEDPQSVAGGEVGLYLIFKTLFPANLWPFLQGGLNEFGNREYATPADLLNDLRQACLSYLKSLS